MQYLYPTLFKHPIAVKLIIVKTAGRLAQFVLGGRISDQKLAGQYIKEGKEGKLEKLSLVGELLKENKDGEFN